MMLNEKTNILVKRWFQKLQWRYSCSVCNFEEETCIKIPQCVPCTEVHWVRPFEIVYCLYNVRVWNSRLILWRHKGKTYTSYLFLSAKFIFLPLYLFGSETSLTRSKSMMFNQSLIFCQQMLFGTVMTRCCSILRMLKSPSRTTEALSKF